MSSLAFVQLLWPKKRPARSLKLRGSDERSLALALSAAAFSTSRLALRLARSAGLGSCFLRSQKMAMQQMITIRARDTMSTQKPTGDPPNRGTWSLPDASPDGGSGTSVG